MPCEGMARHCVRTARRGCSCSAPGREEHIGPIVISTLFIDFDETSRIPSMFRLMQIEDQMTADLGMHVTITTRDALHPLMRDDIERDAIRVL
jgi:hypothetical protein